MFKKAQEHGKRLESIKKMSSSYTWNKKHLSKQVVITTYTLEKKIFAVATFEGWGVVSFKTE